MSAIILAATSACDGGKKNSTDTPGTEDSLLIRRSDIRIENKRLTPEALWAMGRIGGVAVSPDASKVAYTVSYYSVPQNKSNTEIFLMNADGSGNTQLTQDAWQENQPVWIKEGKKLAYLSNESGSTQVWQMDPDGTDRRQLTDYEGGIEGFAFSPDGEKLLFIAQVKTVKTTAEKYPDLPKASGIIVDDLMYKHWDEWTTSAPHPFVADFDGDEISNVRDLLEGEPYESPMKPFGGIEQLAWSPDSKKIAYTCRKKTGLAYAVSTDSDIYLYDLKSDSTLNLCKDPGIKKMAPLEIKKALAGTPVVKGVGLSPEGDKNEGYDTNPQFSPDGRYIAWQSMARDGYESDRNRLYVLDLEKNEKFCADAGFDTNVDSYVWASDSMFYLTATWHGTTQIYRLGLNDWREGKQSVRLTEGLHDYGSIALCGSNLIATRHSMSQADEIYVVAPGTAARNQYAESRQLTQENRHIYDQLEMGRVEERWIKTTDQKDMLVWVIYPPQFDPKKKYPTLLYCEGGPQSPLSQFWSYRWNFQMMAANDYIIVAPCRRGMPGFGTEWNEAISGDYGGQCMQDLLTAIDEVWDAWAPASAASPSTGWPATTKAASRHSSPTTASSTWRCSTWRRKRNGSPTGTWAAPTGTRRTRRPSAPSPTRPTSSWTNGTRPSSASTASATTASWPTRPWPPSMPPNCAASRRSCSSSPTRTTGCSSRRTACCGNGRSSPGWTSG